MLRLWGVGVLLEAVLVLAAATVLVRPEPPLVARLRGDTVDRSVAVLVARPRSGAAAEVPPWGVPPSPTEDSFYTVLHWPLDKPLLAGGGRVLAIPMGFWWVPALYFCGVPLLLTGLTIAWLLARRREPPAAAMTRT